MENSLLAKSFPPETIKEHTDNLIKNYLTLKKTSYLDSSIIEKYDETIKKMLHYHDFGKLNHKFQNKLRHILKLNPINIKELKNYDEIPHEWLSLCFISEEDKNYFKTLNSENIKIRLLIQYCIAFHHNRSSYKMLSFNNDIVKNFIKYDLDKNKHKLNIEYELNSDFDVNDIKRKIFENDANFKNYFQLLVLFKGILHKCDYSASAGIEPEIVYDGNYTRDLENWANGKKITFRDYQKKAKELYSKDSIVFIASTGAGKTEYAMNWINGNKAFYMLGIKIAVNEMYKRFKSIFGKNNVSLVHSDTSSKLIEDTDNTEDYFDELSRTRQFSYPLNIITADQIVTSVFKYTGFELNYLVASYSKIVVDEIQSFSPDAIASIVMFLKDIHKLGGKFLLMTATLPPFIKKEFENMNVKFPEPYLNEQKRHKIRLKNNFIDDDETIAMIEKLYNEGKKVLVICNIVRRAQDVYDKLEAKCLKPKLIHSRFTVIDKKEKERLIMEATQKENKNASVFVSTQIVEASLDIDFDILFSEFSTIDSLLQRFGRCYRKRETDYQQEEPNIYICNEGKFTTRIYDGELLNRTKETLSEYDRKVVTEKDKQDIIEKVFSNIETSKYYQKFSNYKKLLEAGFRAENKSESQKLFRQIFNNYTVIPEPIYEKKKEEIKSLIKDIGNKNIKFIERQKKKNELMNYTLSVQVFGSKKELIKNEFSSSEFCDNNIFLLIGVKYTFEKGLTFIDDFKDESNFIE